MQARTKPLIVIEVEKSKNLTESIKFDKPNKKENCKIISSENVEELVNLLQNEAKSFINKKKHGNISIRRELGWDF